MNTLSARRGIWVFSFQLVLSALSGLFLLGAGSAHAVGLSVTSVTGPASGTYKTGQALSFTVNYNAAATVTGTPLLPLTIGVTARNASYASGNGTTALVFSYTVQGTDLDVDGITSTSPLVLNSGTIKDSGANNASLTFTAPNTSAVLVGLQRARNAPVTLYARPGGTSYNFTIANGNNGTGPLTPILDYAFDNVTAFGWNLTRGHVEYSSNGGSSWTSYVSATGNFVTVAGKIWRYVDTTSGDTTTSNSVGNHWHLVATPSSTTGTGGYAVPDNAPTDIASNKSAIFSNAAVGDTLARLTPADTGDPTGGFWAIDSQSVSNLFTIAYDNTTSNTATLKLGTGTMPAVGQTATVTAHYYDVFQTDNSGIPLSGQGFSKVLTFTVVSEVSNDLTLGNDVAVNTYTSDNQSGAAVAQLSNGNVVVVWQSAGQGRSSTSTNSIRGQILSSTGTAVGSEFLASNSGTTVDDSAPSVAALNSGRFVVAYVTYSGTTYDIAFRIIEANGTVGSQVFVKSGTEGHYNPAVTTLTDGSFVVAWSADSGDIRLHQYNASNGTSAATEVVIANGTTAGGYYPAVAALSTGNYAVAWVDSTSGAVYTKVGGGSAVSTGIISTGTVAPRLAGLASGFVVASDTYDTGTALNQINAVRYNNSAVIQGSVFRANTVTAGNHYAASVVTLSGGGFVIGWYADAGDYDLNGLFGRRFAANGTAVDAADFEINQHRANDQSSPALVPLANDLFAAAWTGIPASAVLDGTYLGDIYARFLLPPSSPPTVTSLSISSGSTAGGTSIAITGTNFTGATGVSIGGTAATSFTVNNATTITATTPAHAAGTASVVVTTPAGSNGVNTLYTYVAPPAVSGISPTSGSALGGTSITITGTDFTGATGVTIGGAAATSVTVVSPTSITATTPAGTAGTASVVVTTAGGSNGANTLYTYIAPPAVTGISPASGTTLGSTSVTITGAGFTGATAVTIGGTSATGITVVSSTSITASTPAHAAGTASVVVTTPAGSNGANTLYTYVTPPSLTVPGGSTTLTATPGGTAGGGVTFNISGANLTGFPGNLTVTAPANVNVSPDGITWTTSGSPSYTVAYASGTLASTAVHVRLAGTGTPGSIFGNISISGGGAATVNQAFSGTLNAGTPTANTQSLSVLHNTAKAITLAGSDPDSPALTLTYSIGVGPAHGTLSGFNASTGAVTYTPAANYQGADSFTFTASNGTNTSSAATITLTVAPGTPTATPQSPSVTFNTAKGLTLAGTDPDVPALSLTYAIATNPSHGTLSGLNAGTGAVTYTPTTGYSGPDSFTFTTSNGTNTSAPATVSITVSPGTPVVSGVSPPSGSTGGGTSVTITGTNFTGTSSVTFGGLAATLGTVTATSITVTTPAHAAGAVDIVITATSGQGTGTGLYTYVDVPLSLSGGALSIDASNSSGAANTTLRYVTGPGGPFLEVYDPGRTVGAGAGMTQVDAHTVRIPIASVTTIDITGSPLADFFLLDFSNGDFYPPGGMSVNGGLPTTSPGDTLAFAGTFSDGSYDTGGVGSGSIDLGYANPITFTGLEPLDFSASTFVNFTVDIDPGNVFAGNLTTTVASADAGVNTQVSFSAGGLESVKLGSVTGSLTINGDNVDNDYFQLVSLGSAMVGDFSVDGQGGDADVVEINNTTFTVPGAGKNFSAKADFIGLGRTSAGLQPGVLVCSGNITLEANGDSTLTPPLWGAGGVWGTITPAEFFSSTQLTTRGTIHQRGDIIKSSGADATLTLKARANVALVNATPSAGSITSTNNKLNVIIDADSDSSNGGAVQLQAFSSIVSNGGDITIGGGATPATGPAIGITGSTAGVLLTSTTVNSGGGNISVRGTGLAGTNGIGVMVNTSNAAGSTQIMSGAGSLTVVGTGGGNFGTAHGVQLVGLATGTQLAKIFSSTGPVSITGTATGGNNSGVLLNTLSEVSATGNASVTLTGTGSGTGFGINMTPIAAQTAKVLSTGGNITLVGDTMNLDGGAGTESVSTTGGLTVKPLTAGLAIDLGAADTASLLGLGLTELANLTAPTLTIGSATSGAINISAVIAPSTFTTLALANNTSFAATGGFTTAIGPLASNYKNITVAGTVAINSDATLNVSATGGFVPSAGQFFTLVSNDAADAISGSFSGLAQGTILPAFLGSGLTETLTYLGGTGNDLVIGVAPAVTLNTAGILASTTTLVINGTGFDGSTPGNNIVAFSGGVNGTVTAATATSLTVTSLSGLTLGSLTAVVTTGGLPSGAAVQVATVDTAMFVTPASLPNAEAGLAYIQSIGSTGGTGTVNLVVSGVTNTTGLAISGSGSSSVTVTGPATSAGTVSFTVTPSDAFMTGTPRTYSFSVAPAVVLAPVSPLQAATAGVPYSKTITASGGSGSITLATSSVVNAPGLTVPASSPSPLTLSGTPSSAGTVSFNVMATDSIGTSAAVPYSVVVNPAVSYTPSSLPDGTATAAYSQTITRTPGTGTGTVTLAVSGLTNTVTGISVTGSGTSTISISGTPTTTGSVSFTVTPTDLNGAGAGTVFSFTVGQATSTITLASSVNPTVFGQSTTFTATVSPVAPATGVATGTVSFLDGAIFLGSTPLAGGVATLTTSSLNVASHSLVAVYSGSTQFTGSTSSVFTQVVNQAATTSALSSSINPTVFGQSTSFTATVSAVAPGFGTPTGTVTFFDGAGPLGTASLVGGVATFATSSLSVASHSITAVYAGDASFTGSTASEVSQSVLESASSTALTSSLNPSTFNQTVTFTATVSATTPGTGTPTGSTSFFDGATLLGTSTLSGGIATLSTSSLSAATHSVTAVYSGDSGFNGNTSNVLSQVVNGPVALPGSIAGGIVGTLYNAVLTATGGTGTKTLTVSNFSAGTTGIASPAASANTLTFSSTPVNAGTVGFDVLATDGNAATATQSYSFVVQDVVSVTATDATANKSGDPGTYTFTRLGSSGSLVVSFVKDGASTATAAEFSLSGTGVTYAAGAGTVTFPDGISSIAVTLTGVDDALHSAQAAKTLRLNVVATAGSYVASESASATVNIAASGFVVVNTHDAGDGSLRQAVLNANLLGGNPYITFAGDVFTDATPDTITLTSGELAISNSLTLQGPGASLLSLDGNNTSRVLSTTGGTIAIKGVTLTNGNGVGSLSTGNGGALYNVSATLNLINCAVAGNHPAGLGGGIRNDIGGTLNVVGSLVANNSTPASNTGGGIDNAGILAVVNSTVSGNNVTASSGTGGGGISSSGTATLVNATITGNAVASAGSASGVCTSAGTVTVSNSIIAANLGNILYPDVTGGIVINDNLAGKPGAVPSFTGTGTFTSGGYNLIGNVGTVASFTATGDHAGGIAALLDPQLLPLANNGGPTLTHAFQPSSLALNGGSSALIPADLFDLDDDSDTAEALPYDQRGRGFARIVGPSVDIGAFELPDQPPVLSTVTATTLEDTVLPLTASVFTTGFSDPDADQSMQAVKIISLPVHGVLKNGSTPVAVNDIITTAGLANLTYLPALNYNGADTFLWNASDGQIYSLASASANLTITAVNDAPSFTKGGNITVLEDSGAFTQAAWAKSLSAGPADESGQLLDFQVVGNTNPGLFTVAPAISPTGTLTFTVPVLAYNYGSAMITVKLHDDGGTDNGGVDSSPTQCFTITVTHVNHAPYLVGGGVPAQLVTIGAGDINVDLSGYFADHDEGDVLSYALISNSAPGKAAASLTGHTLKLSPVAHGSTQVTLTISDNHGGSVSQTFTVTTGTANPTLTLRTAVALNPQTGLLEQKITITNTMGRTIDGFRFTVTNLPSKFKLWNATSTTQPIVDYKTPIAPDATVVVTLSFYSATRSFGSYLPTYTVVELVNPTTPKGDGQGESPDRVAQLDAGEVLVEFVATVGHSYQIQYSDDGGTTWKLSPVGIKSGATKAQWIDRGSPYTDTPPASPVTRQYLVDDVTP